MMRGVDLYAAVHRLQSAASVHGGELRHSLVHSPAVDGAGHQRLSRFTRNRMPYLDD